MKKTPTAKKVSLNKTPEASEAEVSLKNLSLLHFLVIIFSFVAMLFLGWKATKLFLAELHYREAYFLIEKNMGFYSIQEMEKAVTNAPYEPQFGLYLGKAYETYAEEQTSTSEKIKYYEKALSVYAHIAKQMPNNPWYFHRQYTAYDELHKLDPQNKRYLSQAKYFSLKAAQIDKHNPLFTMNHAQLLHRIGEYDAALPFYQKAYDFDKSISEAKYNMADIYIKKEQYRKALDCYNLILKDNPNYENAAIAASQIYIYLKESNRGFEVLKNAYESNTSTPNLYVYKMLATMYQNKNDYKNALVIANKYLATESPSMEMVRIKITSMGKLGYKKEALKVLDTYLSSPQDPDVIAALNQLKRQIQ